MRNELQHIERIDQYLNNELSATETIAFEQELQNNSTLQTQLETQKLLKQAALRKAIKADIAKYGGSSSMGFNWSKWLGVTGIIVLIIGAIWLGKDVLSKTENNNEHNQLATAHKDSTKVKMDTFVTVPTDSISQGETALTTNSNASEKPKNKETTYSEDTYCGELKTWVKPDIQKYTIDPSKGATIEGKDGTLVIVPSDAFVDNNGIIIKENVTLEIVEALKVSDMIAYNLTTMNGDKPLQTGGMLYIQPYVNGEKVEINSKRPLYVEIPTDEYNPSMMAWNGKIDENGDIDWQNPQPLKRYLTKVDFDNLDFLPNGFEEAVAAGMPFKSYKKADKKLVDSLYYSLGITTTNSKKEYDCNFYDKDNLFEGSLSDTKFPAVFSAEIMQSSSTPVKNGYVELRIMDKVFGKGMTDNNGKIIIEKLPIGTCQVKVCFDGQVRYVNGIVLKENRGPITVQQINVNNITPVVKTTITKDDSNKNLTTNSNNSNKVTCFINPLSVQTIKSDNFSNTFLATKEFEQRLKVLHQMPNAQQLFDLYVTNLSKDLHVVDSMVAAELNGENKKHFTDFAAQQLTNVKDANIYQEQLTEFYNSKKKEYEKELTKAKKEYDKISLADLNKYQNELRKLTNQNIQNYAFDNNSFDNYKIKEGIANLHTSYKVPPIKPIFVKPNVVKSPAVYATNWYTSGWKNIDAYIHMLFKENKEVEIDIVNEENIKNGARIYQCINILKTVIPLTVSGVIAKAKFPKSGSSNAKEMSNTFAIGIYKTKSSIQFAKALYNPYETNKVTLVWNEVSEEYLKQELKILDVETDEVFKDLEQQEILIKKQIEIEIKKAEQEKERKRIEIEKKDLEAKIAKIQTALALEKAFIQTLENVVNSCGLATSNSTNLDAANSYFEVQPEFPGGQAALYDFLSKNLAFPKEAIEQGIEGKVYIQFTVETDGSITNITVLKSDHQLLNQAAVDVIRKMPKWGPATNEGSVIKVAHTLPINFQKY